MPLRTEAYYRGIAEDALLRAAIIEPPVPLEHIAEKLGIPVRLVNLPEFFTAATVTEDGLPVFVVNWARPEEDRRRALAHMLGHVLLLMSDPADVFPRDQRDHSEADLVAGEIILPRKMVIDQAQLWFNDHRYLARLFGVAEDAMLSRMRDLGLVKSREGIAWDF